MLAAVRSVACGPLLLAVLGVACGPTLRVATYVSQPLVPAEATKVEFPPPPASVEFVTSDPGPPCVWLDGEWGYVEETWQWLPGGWFAPPEGCVYAEPVMRWEPAPGVGTLYYAKGRWVRVSAAAPATLTPCSPVEPCRAPSVKVQGQVVR